MKTNPVEVEFRHADGTSERKFIAIPHGQFQPYSAICDSKKNQFFIWSKLRGTYEEVNGEFLSNIEVTDDAKN
jgi:hypothetical protein